MGENVVGCIIVDPAESLAEDHCASPCRLGKIIEFFLFVLEIFFRVKFYEERIDRIVGILAGDQYFVITIILSLWGLCHLKQVMEDTLETIYLIDHGPLRQLFVLFLLLLVLGQTILIFTWPVIFNNHEAISVSSGESIWASGVQVFVRGCTFILFRWRSW